MDVQSLDLGRRVRCFEGLDRRPREAESNMESVDQCDFDGSARISAWGEKYRGLFRREDVTSNLLQFEKDVNLV
jgi:hypothetical protein